MKRKKDKKSKQKTAPQQEFHFELQEPKPVFKETGERDYFTEYYRAYKNDYIDQYLRAYRELKNLDAAFKKVDEDIPPQN